MSGKSGTPQERRNVNRQAAYGGLAGLVVVAIVIGVVGGSWIAIVPLIGAAVLLVMLAGGRLGD